MLSLPKATTKDWLARVTTTTTTTTTTPTASSAFVPTMSISVVAVIVIVVVVVVVVVASVPVTLTLPRLLAGGGCRLLRRRLRLRLFGDSVQDLVLHAEVAD